MQCMQNMCMCVLRHFFFYKLKHFLLQISCLSSSTSLANRALFSHHFQVSASEILLASGFYGIIRAFGWGRIAIITQDENLFTVVHNKLHVLYAASYLS